MPTRIVVNGREVKNPLLRGLATLAGMAIGGVALVLLLSFVGIGLLVAGGLVVGTLLLVGLPAMLLGGRKRRPLDPGRTGGPRRPADRQVIDVEAEEIE